MYVFPPILTTKQYLKCVPFLFLSNPHPNNTQERLPFKASTTQKTVKTRTPRAFTTRKHADDHDDDNWGSTGNTPRKGTSGNPRALNRSSVMQVRCRNGRASRLFVFVFFHEIEMLASQKYYESDEPKNKTKQLC